MSDFHIPRGQTVKLGVVEGELRVGNNATIEASNGKNVIVTGGVYLEGKAHVNGDLECDSIQSGIFFSQMKEIGSRSNRARLELTGKYAGKLEMTGSLTVHKQLNVSHSVEVTGAINAADIDVGGKIQASSIKCGRIRVGGRADIENTFEASSVDVGGKVVAPGTVKIGDLNVGGEVEVGGGSITGNIRVGGKFTSKRQLEFGELLVYGKGFLPAGCRGHKVSTFGKLEVNGNITCDIIEAGGVIEIMGNCNSQKIEVDGKFEVTGSLFVSDGLKGCGTTEIEGNLECGQLRISGKLRSNKIIVKEEADISGKLETKEGLKAKLLIVRSGSRCEGVLIGERVEVGKSVDLGYGGWGAAAVRWAQAGGMARVDDVYASDVVIGRMSRAERIFAETVKIEQCTSIEQITYTKELKTDSDVAISQPPQKVTNLPPAPF